MANRQPYNVNFCIFVECAYLQDLECTRDDCVFNPKLIRWWEHHRILGPLVFSRPPSGKYAIDNLYYDSETDEHIVTRADMPED